MSHLVPSHEATSPKDHVSMTQIKDSCCSSGECWAWGEILKRKGASEALSERNTVLVIMFLKFRCTTAPEGCVSSRKEMSFPGFRKVRISGRKGTVGRRENKREKDVQNIKRIRKTCSGQLLGLTACGKTTPIIKDVIALTSLCQGRVNHEVHIVN